MTKTDPAPDVARETTNEPDMAKAREDDPIGRAEAWLRQCSDWMLSNDLDMQCPMEADPLDIADDLQSAASRIAALEARVKVLEEALREALWIINEGVSVDISDAELRAAHPEDRRFIKRTHRLVEAARAALGERHD